MLYKEFSSIKQIEDKNNPFSTLFEYDDGSRFYIEPIFNSYFSNFCDHYPDKKDVVLKEMERVVKLNKKVIFTGMDEETDEDPVTKADDYIIYTFFDITNKLQILVESKSRGSDYGD